MQAFLLQNCSAYRANLFLFISLVGMTWEFIAVGIGSLFCLLNYNVRYILTEDIFKAIFEMF